jgi:hypothetical protein
MREEVRGWFVAAWGLLVLLAVLSCWVVPRSLVRCAMLTPASEPAGWREWPLADPSALSGTCYRALGAYQGVYGKDDDTPRTGDAVTLVTGPGDWFPGEWLRRDPAGDVYVIAGPPHSDEAPKEGFRVAVRRSPAGSLHFASLRGAVATAATGTLLGVMLVGLAVANLRLRTSRRLATVVRDAHLALAADPPTHRSVPFDAVPPPSPTLLSRGRDAANRALIAAFLVEGVVLVVVLLWAVDVAFKEIAWVLL